MYSFKELRKASKLQPEGEQIRVAVLGNCSTQFFATAVTGYAKLENLNVDLLDTDYDQIDGQLLDTDSEVYRFAPQYVILWLATERLYEEFLDLPFAQKEYFAENYIGKLRQYWELIRSRLAASVIQMNFTEIDDKVLGNYSAKTEKTFIYQIRKLNWLLEEAMHAEDDIYPLDLLSVQIKVGQSIFYEPSYYYNARMTVSTKALPYVAKAVTDILKALSGRIKKCIVLDLDNTLWGGVIGEDGMSGIEIGELGRGHAFTDFQRWLKQLKEYGIILAVCSKNDEETAKEPFERHEDMVLRLSDISVFVANWEDKASNIRLIQETLNIGMDSMIFLDDNPFERELVRQKIPQIEVPELPEDPARYLDFLQGCNYFDTGSFSGQTEDRTGLYQAEFQRKKIQITYESIDDYLRALAMIGEAKPFEPAQYPRIAQLTQRSNQFNLRTVRYTPDAIRQIAEDKECLTLSYTLKDKFGEHGLVGVIIMKKTGEKELFIDTWLMSCRVLKRGMEQYMMNKAVETAVRKGCKRITAEYIPTAKNRMVEEIYPQMGFETIGDNRYAIDVEKYQKKEVSIQEVSDEQG